MARSFKTKIQNKKYFFNFYFESNELRQMRWRTKGRWLPRGYLDHERRRCKIVDLWIRISHHKIMEWHQKIYLMFKFGKIILEIILLEKLISYVSDFVEVNWTTLGAWFDYRKSISLVQKRANHVIFSISIWF